MQSTSIAPSRREREIQYKRGEILSAAQKVFAEKGYSQATLEEIAQEAEFGKGTLYNYFPEGKQEILLAIFERLYDQLCDLIESTFDSQKNAPFKQQLHSFFEQTFSFFFEKLNLFVILIREAHRIGASDDPRSRDFFTQQRNRSLDALSKPVQRAIDNGEITCSSSTFLAHLILVNVKGCQMNACKLWSEPKSQVPQTPLEMADFLTQLIYHGVATSNATASK